MSKNFWIVGGEYHDTAFTRLRPGTQTIHGPYHSYDDALAHWKRITHDTKGISFGYDKCIRCYCCLEVCLHGAIEAKEPLLGKLRRRLIRGK